jgi:uncharacterized damage-inducible protein DinB
VPSLERLFAYDAWANAEAAASIRAAGAPATAVRLIAHVAAAERLWKVRLDAAPESVIVWPDWTVDEAEAEMRRLAAEWKELAARLGPSDGRRAVGYVNSKGERWTTAVDDILAHVLLHSSYHRGQVAYVLRAAGETPAYTDYAHCVRNGLVE